MKGDTLERLWQSVLRRLPAPRTTAILMYHRITDLIGTPRHLQQLCVSPTHFAEHAEVIRRKFNTTTLDHIATNRFKVPNRSIAMTFDDGYTDNLRAAVPIIERFELPAEIFVTTRNVLTGESFWWDELHRRGGSAELTAPRIGEIHRSLSGLTPEERRIQLDLLPSVPMIDSDCRPMTLEELRSLRKHPLVTIGAHTHSHPRLSLLSVQTQQQEMLAAKQLLEEWLETSISGMAIPFGGDADYTAESIASARDCGYRYCCTTISARPIRGTSRFELPRFMVQDWDGNEFERRLNTWLS
jgi:peptidoglycan/xylan/chitin deacetylase (PgdA/CDA1 family)